MIRNDNKTKSKKDLIEEKNKKRQQKLILKAEKKKEIEEKLNPYKVNIINIWKKYPKKVLWMFVSAFLYNIAITVFLKRAATIASGTSSLSQIITFTAPSTENFYGIFYVLVNLPLMFGFWRHNPRMFMVLTYYWMLFQIIIQCLFIDYTGNGNPIVNFINTKMSIYNPGGKGTYWDPFGAENGTTGAVWDRQTWPVIVYASLGGISEGFASVIAWRQRGSIGGTSVISNYIAYKNKKPVGNMFLIVALCFSTFSTIVIGSLEATGHIAKHPWRGEQFIVRVLGTFIYLMIFTMIVNKFYPKYKKVRIEIYTDKVEWISEHLKNISYPHAYNIFTGYSGYKHIGLSKIETIALYLEKDWIFEEIKKIDKNAWMATSNIHDINGEFDTSYVE